MRVIECAVRPMQIAHRAGFVPHLRVEVQAEAGAATDVYLDVSTRPLSQFIADLEALTAYLKRLQPAPAPVESPPLEVA